MKRRLTSILVALSMMVGTMPVIGHAATEKAIDDSAMIESEVMTDSDAYVGDYSSYEEEIIEKGLTNRFIIEKSVETETSIFKTKNSTISEKKIKTAIIDALSESDDATLESDVEVTELDDKNSIITLSDEVNADEFISDVEDILGDGVAVYPDYPVYFNDKINGENVLNQEIYSNTDLKEWEENLLQAQEYAGGEGVKVAILGSFFMDYDDILDNIYVDNYTVVFPKMYSEELKNPAQSAVVHRVAPDAKIIPMEVFERSCNKALSNEYIYTYTSDIIKAINYAEEKNAQIMVCDWYTNEYNAYLEKRMAQSDMFFVVSAKKGIKTNKNDVGIDYYDLDKYPIYPACFDIDNMITVSDIDDNYMLYKNSCHGSAVDIYANGENISAKVYAKNSTYYDSYKISGVSASVSLVAGAAALVTSKNNTNENLKNILMQSASTVSYMPDTSDYVTYKVLDFYNAVTGAVSDKQVEINTAQTKKAGYDNYYEYGELKSIYYADIQQIVTGCDVMAVLLADGTVNMSVYNDSEGHPFNSLHSRGKFVKIPQLSNITQIAITPDGNGFLAVDIEGNLYEWGKKESIGLASAGVINTPTIDESIGDVESVYSTDGTTWIQQREVNGYKSVLSIGNNTCRAGDKYTFEEVSEANNATSIQLRADDAIIVKNGMAYVNNTTYNGDTYFVKVEGVGNEIVDAAILDKFYALDSEGKLWMFDRTSDPTYMQRLKTTQIIGDKDVVCFRHGYDEFNDSNTGFFALGINNYGDENAWWGGMNLKECGIKSACLLKHPTSSGSFDKAYSGYYILMEDGTLYYAPIFERYDSIYCSADFRIVAQKEFEEKSIKSIEPINIVYQYDPEVNILDEVIQNQNDRMTIMLDDDIVITVPVQWDTSNYVKNKAGKQTVIGSLTLPENIVNPNGLEAQINITTLASIENIEDIHPCEIPVGTKLPELEAKLPQEVEVTLSTQEVKKITVDWDTSSYDPQLTGEQYLYGELILDEYILNPEKLKPEIKVIVNGTQENLAKIEAGYKHIVGLTSEGEIKVAGNAKHYSKLLFPSSPLDITGWNNSDDRIIDVYAVADNTVALTEHGKVFASGKIAGIKRPGQSKRNKQIIEEDWSNVEAIYVGYSVIAAKMKVTENGEEKIVIKYVTSSDADNALVAALENLNNDKGLNDIGNPMFAIGSVHYVAKGANSWHSSYMPQGANDNRSLPSGLQDISALFAESRYSAAIFDRIVNGEVMEENILAITGYKADNTMFSHNLSVNTNNPPTTPDFVGVKKVAGYEDGYAVLMNDGTVSFFDIGSADRQLEIPENTVFPNINDLTEVYDLAINKGSLITGDLTDFGINIMNSFAVCLKRDGTVKLIELFDKTALQEFYENYEMNGVNNNGLDAVNEWKLF